MSKCCCKKSIQMCNRSRPSHHQTQHSSAPYSCNINVYSSQKEKHSCKKKECDEEDQTMTVDWKKECETCEPLKQILAEKDGDLKEEFQLYNAILFHLSLPNRNIKMLIDAAVENACGYSNLMNSMQLILNYHLPKVVRILIALPDGTVLYDSSRGGNNTYNNFLNKEINENHNTRVAIIDAQLNKCGIGYERKNSLSQSTPSKTIYVACRVGTQYNNSGTFRLSEVST